MTEFNPALASLLNMSTIMTPPDTVQQPQNNPIPGPVAQPKPMPSYALGGMVGPGGQPVRPNIPGMPGLSGPSAGGMGPQQMELEARRFVQQHPEQVAQIREAVQEAMDDGDITQQQLVVLTNMARVALQNPEMYPQLKQAIISQGILEQDELPPEFDQGVMFIFLLISQVMQSSAPVQPGMQAAGGSDVAAPTPGSAQPPGQMPSMKKGGALPARSPNDDGSIPIRAHEGEYVVPSHVVRAKGTEFFDKLVQSYTQPKE